MGEAPEAGGHGNKEREFPETLDEGSLSSSAHSCWNLHLL
jgi:hypothetical protein